MSLQRNVRGSLSLLVVILSILALIAAFYANCYAERVREADQSVWKMDGLDRSILPFNVDSGGETQSLALRARV